jgi:ABC-type glycerol-3-phosphate transport system permease component
MNRIRAGYLEVAPDLERFFVMGVRDDREALLATMGMMPRRSQFAHLLSATPMLIATLNSVLVAAIATLLTLQLSGPYAAAIAAAVVTFSLSLGGHLLYARREIERSTAAIQPMDT